MSVPTKKILISVAKFIAAIAAVLLLWWLAAVITDSELILPEPLEVLKITWRLLGEGATYIALSRTVLRALAAFCISFVIAAALCVGVGLWHCARPFVDGFVAFLRSVPTMSVILLAMVAFRSSVVPVFVAVLVALPIIYSAFTRETEADDSLVDVCEVFAVKRAKKLRYVLLPQMSRVVLPQIRDVLPFCIKIVISGEVMALPRLGLGRQLYVAKVNIETSEVMALTLLALVVCFVIGGVARTIENRIGLDKRKS